MRIKLLIPALATGALLLGFSSPEEQGKQVFGRRCSGCHAEDLNKEGPRLRGVYGRQAASVPGFGYSDALKNAGILWDKEKLEQWLRDPESVVPNSDMAFRLSSAEERAAVIAFLASLKEAKD